MNNIFDSLVVELEHLGFSQLESKIYLALISGGKMSAYQLAKKIDIARPSIYNALEHMVDKGMVEYVPEKTPFYIAKDYKLLLAKIEDNMNHSLESAGELLEQYEKSRVKEEIVALTGYADIILQAKDIIKNAVNDIYINADFNLDIFNEEFEQLKGKGVKIYAFSFYDISKGNDWVELFSHNRPMDKEHFATRLMLVEYDNISLVAGCNSQFDEWKGMINNLPLNVNIVAEHIHNDIYMLKWRDEYGKEIYNRNKLGSMFEDR